MILFYMKCPKEAHLQGKENSFAGLGVNREKWEVTASEYKALGIMKHINMSYTNL